VDAAAKRPSSITFLLVGFVLLVTVVGLMGTFVRLADCPDCVERRKEQRIMETYAQYLNIAPPPKWKCERCQGTDRISLFSKWLKRPHKGPDWLID